jgi:pimeloyl-ACP methyl ester carboxylesterase
MSGRGGVVVGSGTDRALLFLPGFMAPARAYLELVAPLARDDPGLSIRVPQLYRRGPSALTGRRTVGEEARVAGEMATQLVAEGHVVWLGGHSRGGQAAWLAAEALARSRVDLAGLILVDPVDGSGPRSGPTTTTRAADFAVTPLIVGAGLAGSCAPEALNHHRFGVAAAATHPVHVVVTALGHADVLGGRARTIGRRLCGGASDPDAGRSTVTALMAAHMGDTLTADRSDWPSPILWC